MEEWQRNIPEYVKTLVNIKQVKESYNAAMQKRLTGTYSFYDAITPIRLQFAKRLRELGVKSQDAALLLHKCQLPQLKNCGCCKNE